MKKILGFVFAAGALLALGTSTASAQQVYVAHLSGAQVVPANNSAARGVAVVTLNAAETQVTVNVTYAGLSSNATAGHTHAPFPVGANGNILLTYGGVAGTSGTINQTFSITPLEVQQMRNGLHYIDIHTDNFPDGEIRGQLKLANKLSEFDGDGRADVAVWRPNNGFFFIRQSLRGANRFQQWGVGSDFPVPMDYDGDGLTDLAIVRPGDNSWYILQSSNRTIRVQQWGSQAQFDFPVPGDYDGDGRADIAVYRTLNATWYIFQSSTGTARAVQFGQLSFTPDIPVPGDYDRDGRVDIAIYRQNSNTWFIQRSSNGAVIARQFGAPGDRQLPADYDGDGRTDIAVWRPNAGTWYVLRSSDGALAAQQFGQSGDTPLPFDFDGDGRADFAVFRPLPPNGTQSFWYILNSNTGSLSIIPWGVSGDTPV